MKKIMILGSSGMLGHMVYHYLTESKKYQILDASFPNKANGNSYILNVTDKDAVELYINNEKPDIVINCIGVLIKGSKSDPSNAIYLNAYFPHQLSKLLSSIGGKLIHISTDCVFSGNKGNYAEDDFRDADDVYGRSKALGEVINDKDLTIRTSIIGPELKENGEGLFHWFMSQNGPVNGYANAYWSGVTTLFLAQAIEAAIDQNIKGLFHLTNRNKISKYDLLTLIKNIWDRKKVGITKVDSKTVDKSLINTRTDFDVKVPEYNVMLGDLKSFMIAHKIMYPNYFQS